MLVLFKSAMWQGKTFRVKREILAVRGREDLQYIPVGALVEVVSNHDSDAPKFIDVRWNGTDYSVFAIDLAGRGEETAASQSNTDPTSPRSNPNNQADVQNRFRRPPFPTALP